MKIFMNNKNSLKKMHQNAKVKKKIKKKGQDMKTVAQNSCHLFQKNRDQLRSNKKGR